MLIDEHFGEDLSKQDKLVMHAIISKSHANLLEYLETFDLRFPTFQCVNFPYWERMWDENTDAYGRACLVFANMVAYGLDCEILKHSEEGFIGLKSSDFIQDVINKADDIAGGLTGFMYIAAITVLSKCWRYGKELYKWCGYETKKLEKV